MDQQQNLKAPLSVSERIAVLRGRVTSAREVKQTIGEAQKVVATPDDVKLFFEAVAKGDSIAVFYRSREIPRREAVREWLSLPWEEWLGRLRSLAAKDPIAKEAVEVYEAFAGNRLLLQQLQEILDRFERPCRAIHTKDEIIIFLEELVEKGLAEKSREHPGRKAIHWDNTWYTPRRGIPPARLGWLFVVRATIRAQRRETADQELLKRLQPLLGQATISNEPEDGGLTRILGGEVGAVVPWDPRLHWGGENRGLFATALSRQSPGVSLVSLGCDADFPLPEMFKVPYELPSLHFEEKVGGRAGARFIQLPRLDREEYRVVKMIERLINHRLDEEERAAVQVKLEVEPVTV